MYDSYSTTYTINFPFGILFQIVCYVLWGIALMKLAQQRGIKNSWLSWIPFARMYQFGQIADDIHREQGKKTNWRTLIMAFSIALVGFWSLIFPFSLYAQRQMMYSYVDDTAWRWMMLGPLLSMLIFVSLIFFLVFYIRTFSAIFKEYAPEHATAYTVMAVLLGFIGLGPIFILNCYQRQPLTAWRKQNGWYLQAPNTYVYYPPYAQGSPTYPVYPPQSPQNPAGTAQRYNTVWPAPQQPPYPQQTPNPNGSDGRPQPPMPPVYPSVPPGQPASSSPANRQDTPVQPSVPDAQQPIAPEDRSVPPSDGA